ncbi:BAG family molecular chaperone regulator 1-like [Diospyros lotus]|uniref:BAG family molecular chaperone regulator 1-like n=1 Tax=Diospyros lotus TaxID=55363 RepID=UPI0022520701|nr:BAG family molecular chaperone regulator 1-like [Diospyros lotus]XP_052210218.1 BAG family molecular chaperone regulator 1-like [Diospyros lotus]
MLKTKSRVSAGVSSPARPGAGEAAGWEVRPGGMLVQKRNSDQTALLSSKIKLAVKFGSSFHQLTISPQASFGELKKMLAGPTGLHPQDQKLIYRDKERNSKAFLDVAGVTDGSKIVLVEDVTSRERRLLNDNMDKAPKAIAEIGLEIDTLAKKVSVLELEICGGKKASEAAVVNLTEVLMTKLLKLDEIVANGDAKMQRREQVRRVQKYIETLDRLKIKNASNGVERPFHQKLRHSTNLATLKPNAKLGANQFNRATSFPSS